MRVLSYLTHEQEGFIRYKDLKHSRAASVLNGLKNDQSYEFIGEVIFKINVVYAKKIKAKARL